jgi:murein DD-endopeptidase MepM/ murein hydrolase activator NlpD
MSDPRTFKIDTPLMRGDDIKSSQRELHDRFQKWNIDYPLECDGVYSAADRSAWATFLRAWGAESAAELMKNGVTPELRTRVRHDKRTARESSLFRSQEREDYRSALRERYRNKDVAMPVSKILEDSWGYHPPVHDGIDLICPAEAHIYACVTGRVVRADASGWWGKGAPSDPNLKAKGDGIIIVRATVEAGPFKRGMNICYGHAEGAVVSEGQKVHAGQHLGHAGLANAWHVHWMINDNNDTRGVGDRDPRPFLDYLKAHA